MIRKEDFAVIKSLNQHGAFIKDIAEELGVHPQTVSRALKRGSAPKRERKHRRAASSNLTNRKSITLLSEEVWNAMVILREIQADGYAGGYTILRQYIQPKRALRPSRATVRFETRAGRAVAERLG